MSIVPSHYHFGIVWYGSEASFPLPPHFLSWYCQKSGGMGRYGAYTNLIDVFVPTSTWYSPIHPVLGGLGQYDKHCLQFLFLAPLVKNLMEGVITKIGYLWGICVHSYFWRINMH